MKKRSGPFRADVIFDEYFHAVAKIIGDQFCLRPERVEEVLRDLDTDPGMAYVKFRVAVKDPDPDKKMAKALSLVLNWKGGKNAKKVRV